LRAASEFTRSHLVAVRHCLNAAWVPSQSGLWLDFLDEPVAVLGRRVSRACTLRLGAAVSIWLPLPINRKSDYFAASVLYLRRWMFHVTHGVPIDDISTACRTVRGTSAAEKCESHCGHAQVRLLLAPR